jgi:bifunctional DNA-binding transcriptional regulator/antitoxin component of YhaV-PrlF toxin-antitoxin module
MFVQGVQPTPAPHQGTRRLENNAFLHYNLLVFVGIGNERVKTLTVTSRGQVTFRREILRHLGVKAGEKIELELLPGGRGVLRAARPPQKIDSFLGLLAGRTKKTATMEEITEAAEAGWAGKK